MAGEKKKAGTAVTIQANLICRDCGALVAVEKKPSIVHCPCSIALFSLFCIIQQALVPLF